MKLLSFASAGQESWGAVRGDYVVDLGRAMPQHQTLADFLGSPDFARRDALLARIVDGPALTDVAFLPVIPRPEKIVCVLRNYDEQPRDRDPSAATREPTGFPPIFLRVWRSMVGHGAPIIRPTVSDQLDWEGELAVVIGKGGRHIAEEAAFGHVAGYSIINDVSVRDWQRHAQQIAAGKNFVGTGPFGPWLVTPDEIGNPAQLQIQTRVNGAVEQAAETSLLIHSIPRLINYCSTIFDLAPGDVIATGTPAGVGFTRKPPVFLQPGDVVEVEIEKIGVLRNSVVEEGSAAIRT